MLQTPMEPDLENQEHPVTTNSSAHSGVSDRDHRSEGLSSGIVDEEARLFPRDIQNELWIRKTAGPWHKLAYEVVKEKEEWTIALVDKKGKRVNDLYNEIYQLVGFDSVFQGVLLTAVAQANLLNCHNWWAVFFLSLFASLATIGGVFQKFKSIGRLERAIHEEFPNIVVFRPLDLCCTSPSLTVLG